MFYLTVDCPSDPVIDCASGPQTGSTLGAADDWPGITGVSAGGEDSSFTFVVSSAGVYNFSTCGSSFDTMLQVFVQGNLTSIAANDDSDCGSNSTVQSFVSVFLSPVRLVSCQHFSISTYLLFSGLLLDCRGWIRRNNGALLFEH